MDQESNQMEQHPVQCRNGCGFYAGAGTDGLCSVCYKDMIKKRQQPPTNMPASLAPSPGAMAQSPTSVSSASAASAADASCSSSAGSINSSPIKPAQSLETASPTVQLPQTEKSELEASGLDSASADAATATSTATDSPGASAEDSGVKDSGKKKKNRCLECKKKVGLTGFTCRCGGLYCSIHRYSDKHQCDFDYKEAGAAEIRKSNPVVVAKKVQQI